MLEVSRASAEQTSVSAGPTAAVASCVAGDSEGGSTGKDWGSCTGATEGGDPSAEALAAFISAGKNGVAQV